MTAEFRPLDGVTVVDLSQNLPGPLLTRVLADLGARVIKVEPPTGEGLRWMPPHRDGVGIAFAALAAGKESVAVDLRKPEGAALIRALIARADVLVEGFRPGVLARLGLDPVALRAANPRLVVASITGWGQDTPLRAAPGHDLGYLARSGLLAMQGPADRPPQPAFAQVADVCGGAYPAAIGVLAALLERDRTGTGRHLDLSLARGAIAATPVLASIAASGQGQPRGADPLTGGSPCYRCYRTADGRYVAVGALEPKFWGALCEVVGRPDLVAVQYSADPDDHAKVEAVFAAEPLATWVARFAGVDACVEPVATLDEALADPSWDPQVRHAGPHAVFPLHVGAAVPDGYPNLPRLGSDLDRVCADLGVDRSWVDAARGAGAA